MLGMNLNLRLLVLVRHLVAVSPLLFQLLHVPLQHNAEDEGGEDGRVQKGPDADGEHLLVDHAARISHLSDQVRELGATDHGPADDKLGIAHEGRAEDLRQDARADAHERALQERVQREKLTHRNGEGDSAREEDADHPPGHALRLTHPDVVRVARRLEAREGHACDEAAPEVGPQEVRDGSVSEQEDHHDEEEDLVATGHLGIGALGNPRKNKVADDPRPELHGRNHGNGHEGDTNDGIDDRGHDVKVATKAE
mmetsp:Transcript_9630/g.21220  ORF Transcript_9630/g.21220 Transcript_9630/m.21220 type:complete len:254 (-) Transcript_9630:894-1655(-)